MLRTTITRQARLFSTSPRVQKTVVDSAKDAVKKVDRTVSDAAVKGIETGVSIITSANAVTTEKATNATAETIGLKSKQAQGKAAEVGGEAKGKAHEVAGKAKGTAEEVKGKVS
ncbi:MAG: hypothetical protein M1821_004184 [Bathelium mastoideum]|nr:MAG: hypothetical protein M1821_004184 [Bathelium mastoideum]